LKSVNNISGKIPVIVITVLFIALVSFLFFEPKVDMFSEMEAIKTVNKPGVYRENYSDSSSRGSLVYKYPGYVFKYEKKVQIGRSFAGVYFPIENLNIDFEDYDQIQIDLKSERGKRIPIQLSLHYGDSLVRYLTAYIDIVNGVSKYDLNILDFITPAEWFETNKLSKSDLPVTSFNKIQTLTIESCHLLAIEIEDEIEIRKITFWKNRRALLIQVSIVYVLLLTIIFVLDRRRKLKKARIVRMPIEAQDLEKGIENIDKITQYIAKHYSNADLKINDIQKSVGIHHKKIAEELNLKFELSFPQYLALVRIDEAKRLLLDEPDISISEVGFMVGFNTPNNFNRVFKKLENITPSQFRSL
jgi:AraC-like DNA-binding protein